jgi:hypothetical protein
MSSINTRDLLPFIAHYGPPLGPRLPQGHSLLSLFGAPSKLFKRLSLIACRGSPYASDEFHMSSHIPLSWLCPARVEHATFSPYCALRTHCNPETLSLALLRHTHRALHSCPRPERHLPCLFHGHCLSGNLRVDPCTTVKPVTFPPAMPEQAKMSQQWDASNRTKVTNHERAGVLYLPPLVALSSCS